MPDPEAKPATRTKWQPPHVKVEWGSYFRPDPEEQAKIVDMCSKALAGNLAPLRSVVEKLAPIFGFDNVDEIVEQIEEQQAAADERELTKTTAEAEALHKLADGGTGSGAKPGGGAKGGGNSPKARGGGSGGATPAPAKSKG